MEAFFAVGITNPGLDGLGTVEYIWQQSTDNGTSWVDLVNETTANGNLINGVNSDTLSISPVIGLNETQYRVIATTGACDSIITAVATLYVEGPLSIDDHPDDVTLCSGESTSFSILASAAANTSGTIQYQWELSTDAGLTWGNLTNTFPYTGVTTNTLSISDVTNLYNYKYRCNIRTAQCDSTASQIATLFIEGPITIDTQPVDATVCSNIGHTITSEVSNPGSGSLQFQWEVSDDSGTSWSQIGGGIDPIVVNTGNYIGGTTDDLNITLVEGLDGYMYRLVIRTGTCYDTTNEVTLTVLDACLTGTCDFDLDGQINDIDLDDDNDQLDDVDEDWITLHNVLDGWNYLDDLGNLLNMSNCDIDSDDDGIPDNQEDPDGDNINNGEEMDDDGIFDGDPLDPCDPILGPTCQGIVLDIRINLQGALVGVGADTLMRDDLREQGIIPEDEPYTDIPTFTHFYPGGAEFVDPDSASQVFADKGANSIVDWVFVELRSGTALDSVKYTRAALIQRDGDVVNPDGWSLLNFPRCRCRLLLRFCTPPQPLGCDECRSHRIESDCDSPRLYRSGLPDGRCLRTG